MKPTMNNVKKNSKSHEGRAMNHFAQAVLRLVLVLAAFGCAHPAHFATPPGFVSIEDDAYDFRATNADGVVLGVRAMDNDPEGDLAFWAGAIDRRLRQRYEAVEVLEVEAATGTSGIQIRYQTDHGGRLHRYWATIFVHGDRVYLVEAGGDAEFFDPQVADVEEAVLSVDLG